MGREIMLSENMVVEFKREYAPDINKTVVAFANTSGGEIYIGIANDGSVAGVDDVDATMLKISNSVRDSIKPDVTLFADYRQEIIEGKAVIKIIVQKGTSCPYYLAGKGIRPEGVYVRQGASTVPATETAILRMIKETDGEKYEDVRSLQQELTFVETAKEFKIQNVSFGISQQKTLGLMNTSVIYTNLGLLLSDQCVHTIKLAVFEGTVKAVFKDRREFAGSLLKQLNDVFEFIDRYNRNRSEIAGLHRIDKRDYPPEAVREALLNALVHRDYSFSDSTLISIFDDRIEFTSIGGLVKGISFDDMMLGISVARNRNLANVFYRLTLIEAYGTGMPKIMRSYEGFAIKPLVEATNNAFKITLPNTNEAPKKAYLNENEYAVLALFEDKDFIVRKDIEAVLGVSQTMAVRVLKGLVNKGEIRSIGGGKNTRYIIK
ncbi:MAG: putative DNA binding domain-containing protein [Deferribacteraceae bacterium]|jgi:ATP-dependent DNA helicase RecG|nr:putative DNA binding domain-containing protein [Deferribacteraceae bacterium]